MLDLEGSSALQEKEFRPKGETISQLGHTMEEHHKEATCKEDRASCEVLSIRRATARTSMDMQFMSITKVPARTMHGYGVIKH